MRWLAHYFRNQIHVLVLVHRTEIDELGAVYISRNTGWGWRDESKYDPLLQGGGGGQPIMMYDHDRGGSDNLYVIAKFKHETSKKEKESVVVLKSSNLIL